MRSSGVSRDVLNAGGLRFEENGLVATITLDRPATKNSQTPATWHALRIIGSSLSSEVRVVVVTGAGDTFSSGIDRRLLEPGGPAQEGSVMQLLELPAPELAEDARFSMREPLLGLVPDLTGTKPLVDLVGYSRALEICATTRWVPADEARELGLATAVVPSEELDDAVADLVAALTAPVNGAVSETKALLQSASRLGLEDQRLAEREAQVRRLRDLAALMGE
jgi:enoyl-CoA hydratase/carnithine racemase